LLALHASPRHDLDASGQVKVTIDASRTKVCYDFRLSGLSTPLMAHIHRAPLLENGPSVVTLFTGPGGNVHDCRRRSWRI
jgi:hypothetical protein